MTEETVRKPEPHPTEVSQAYWDSAEQGSLSLQKCADCGKIRHYPRLVCDQCYSRNVEWVPASGRGKVYSWTVAHHPFHPAFKDEVPYELVTIELEEGVRVLARWDSKEQLRLDLPVRVSLKKSGDSAPLPWAVTEAE